MSDPVSAEQDAEPVVVDPSAVPAAVVVPTEETVPAEVVTPETDVEEESRSVQLRMRRAPRYLPFGLSGALIGVIAGVVLALSFSATSDYSIRTIAGYFAAIFGLVGALTALGLAVLIERRRR